MKISFYSLKDAKVGFTSIFPMANDEVAKNSLVNTFVNDPRSPISQTPHDFELYHIGKFDDVSGDFSSECYSVGSALDIINEAKSLREASKKLRESLKEVDAIEK